MMMNQSERVWNRKEISSIMKEIKFYKKLKFYRINLLRKIIISEFNNWQSKQRMDLNPW